MLMMSVWVDDDVRSVNCGWCIIIKINFRVAGGGGDDENKKSYFVFLPSLCTCYVYYENQQIL